MKTVAFGIVRLMLFPLIAVLVGSGKASEPGEIWNSQDIGTVPLTGQASYDDLQGTFTLEGAGTDIWDAKDSFFYLYKDLPENGRLTVRVLSMSNTHPWAKSGLMVRESLLDNSKNVFIGLTPSNGITFQKRTLSGGKTANIQKGNITGPVWLRIERHGALLYTYHSVNGQNWTLLGSADLALTGTVKIGMALTSHNAQSKLLSIFDHVELTDLEKLSEPWRRAGIGNAGLPGFTKELGAGFEITAAGKDIWSTSDQLELLYQTLNMNGTISARFNLEEANDKWAKSGVTIRDSLSADSSNVLLAITKSNGITFQKRTVKGGITSTVAGPAWINGPVWLRLERAGSLVIGWASRDGESWTLVGTYSVQLSSTALVGIGATSHSEKLYSKTLIDGISVTELGTAPSIATYLQPPWQSMDLGAVKLPGFAGFNPTTKQFAVNGSGMDIWGASDQFHFVQQTLNGDGEISARISQIQSLGKTSKLGLMVRENLTADSKNIFVGLTPANEILLQQRSSSGSSSKTVQKVSGTIPTWLKIRRENSLFSIWRALDDQPWTLVNTIDATMSENVFIGMAITGRDNTKLATGLIDKVSVLRFYGEQGPDDGFPSEWSQAGVGNPSLRGLGTYDSAGQAYSLYGAGTDIWNKGDQFHYAYQVLPEDGSLVVRLLSIDHTHEWAKAGIMIRSSISEKSANAALLVTPAQLLQWQSRSSTGATTVAGTKGNPDLPVWLKIERTNSVVTSSFSIDGITWTSAGSVTMPGQLLIGLAVTSHNPLKLSRAVFDNVTFSNGMPDDDWDDDGMPNLWEAGHGLDPNNSLDADADPDGDTVSNLNEYLDQKDPQDYYNGVAPILEIIAGNEQIGDAGTFVNGGFDVLVKNGAGMPLPNAPIRFEVAGGTASLAATNSGSPEMSSVLILRTDGVGKILNRVYGLLSTSPGTQLEVKVYPQPKPVLQDSPLLFKAYNFDPFNPPEAPSDQIQQVLPDGKLHLTWTDSSDNETGFVIERSSDGGETWGSPANVAANTTSYTSPEPASPTDILRVNSLNASGVSDTERPQLELEIISESSPANRIEALGLNDKGQVLLRAGPEIAVWDGNRSTDKIRFPGLPPPPPPGEGPHVPTGQKGVSFVGMGLEDAYCKRQDNVSLTAGGITIITTIYQGYRLNLETLVWTIVPGTAPELRSFVKTTTSTTGSDGVGLGEDSDEPFFIEQAPRNTYVAMAPNGNLLKPIGVYTDYGGVNNSGMTTALLTVGTGNSKVVTHYMIMGNGRFSIPAVGMLNEQGWVAGTVTNQAPVSNSAFAWTKEGGPIPLASPGWARSINDLGWTCGYTGSAGTLDPRNTLIATVGTVWIPKLDQNKKPKSYTAYKLDDCIKKNPKETWRITRGFQVNNQKDILAYAVESGKTYLVLLRGNRCSLGVDGNRDGIIQINSAEDKTEQSKPFRFWINNDQDVGPTLSIDLATGEEIVPVNIPDCTTNSIGNKRNLEDLARLWIDLGDYREAVEEGELLVGLSWKNTLGTSPSINIYTSRDPEGSDKYLKDDSIAGSQVLGPFNESIETINGIRTVNKNAPYIIQPVYWRRNRSDQSLRYFLFEGCTEGKGELMMALYKPNGTKVTEGRSIWLDLKDIKKMYSRFEGDQMGNAKPWDETDNTIIFVHGWRMTPDGRSAYAETFYKRLWHRGFKGRFAAFQWDTFYSESWQWLPGLGPGVDVYLSYYNDSEYIAWNSAERLKDFANKLPGTHKHVAAHSMGNVVASEAVRLGMKVENYALMQAAIASACYDDSDNIKQAPIETVDAKVFASRPQFPVPFWTKDTPDDDPDPQTRKLAYRGRFKDLKDHTKLTSFFLPPDYATFIPWQLGNTLTKPRGLLASDYAYRRDNPSGQKLYKYDAKVITFGDEPNEITLEYYLEGRNYEAMAFACSTWGKAQGAQDKAAGSIDSNVDLRSMEFNLPGEDADKTGFGDEHSGQFNANIQYLTAFYETLLEKFGLPVNP